MGPPFSRPTTSGAPPSTKIWDRGQAVLHDRLRTNAVRHLCFPWEVAGVIANGAVRALGFRTAFADRLFGLRAVRAGDDPWRLMRLNGKFIPSLPKRRRALIGWNRR